MIESLLKNKFDMSKNNSGFIDNFSDMEICVNNSMLSLCNLNSRGIDPCRATLSKKTLAPKININGISYPLFISETNTFPWSVTQKSTVFSDFAQIDINATLLSPSQNVLLWFLEFSTQQDCVKFNITYEGEMQNTDKNHKINNTQQSVFCMYNHENHDNPLPLWEIYSKDIEIITTENFAYTLKTKEFELTKNNPLKTVIQLNYCIQEENKLELLRSNTLINPDKNDILKQRKLWWENTLKPILNKKGDIARQLRCAAGLIRCGCKWENEGNIVAPYCSISNWSGLVCFWDALVASVGYSFFSAELAIDAIRAAFLRQREDGYVTSTTYKFSPHDEIYPQPPIASWALLKILENTNNDSKVIEFLDEILPKISKLHSWYVDTQDFDNDSIPEWRFTGSIADNSPLYDYYATPINRDLSGPWNVYLPPIASVSLCSFLIKDAKSLAILYEKTDNKKTSNYYTQQAELYEKKLFEICFDGEMFNDYDHTRKKFNKVMTLYNFLPLWASVKTDEKIKKNLIENFLLNKDHFFGEYPLPYLSYSEKQYQPNGYWRGRIWPHTTVWMLELLYENNYTKEANEIAKRLLQMMNQQEEILENYNSSPKMNGGGEPDFLWSFSSYISIENMLNK